MSNKHTILSALKQSALDQHAMPTMDVVANNDDLVGQFNASLNTVAGTLHSEGGLAALQTSHRVTPFICENLILALAKDNIVANMHQAVKQVALQPGELGLFIAGPSKTADIEQALVVGAHGACSLNVYLY